MRYFALYWHFFTINLKTLYQYKADFAIGAFATLLTQLGGMAMLWLVVTQISDLAGWSIQQLMLLYGLITLARSFDMIFFDNLHALGAEYVREGKFDILLMRPLSPLFQMATAHIQQDGFGLLALGVGLTVYAGNALQLFTSISSILLLLFIVINGALLISAITVLFSALGFVTANSHIVLESVDGIADFAHYPLSVFPQWIGNLTTWVLPYAFISYYPASHLLGFSLTVLWVYPLLTASVWIIALFAWRRGIRYYSSTGS